MTATTNTPRYIQTQLGIAVGKNDNDDVDRAMGMLADYVRSIDVAGADSIEHDGGIVTVTAAGQSFTINPASDRDLSADMIRILGDGYVICLDFLEAIGPFIAACVAEACVRAGQVMS
jgi:hypothetical protein